MVWATIVHLVGRDLKWYFTKWRTVISRKSCQVDVDNDKDASNGDMLSQFVQSSNFVNKEISPNVVRSLFFRMAELCACSPKVFSYFQCWLQLQQDIQRLGFSNFILGYNISDTVPKVCFILVLFMSLFVFILSIHIHTIHRHIVMF